MKVFVAGATGVLGRRVVPMLVGAGHEVTALARSAGKAETLRAVGATPALGDLFDAALLRDAVRGHDAVCNLATHIPPLSKGVSARAWEENTRIRTEGSSNLVDAAIACGVGRFVQESISLLYADGADRWLEPDAPLDPSAKTASAQAAERNVARFREHGGNGVVLRFAMFYGADSGHTQSMLSIARQGVAPTMGRRDAYQSMLHLDDAASAVVAALDAPSGTYNVAEDVPATRAGFAAALGSALGGAPLWVPPAGLARVGGFSFMARSQRVSNRAFRDATGWAPRHPDQWSGWPAVVSPRSSSGRRLFVRAILAYLALQIASIGVWATLAPRSWFDSFPGAGHDWVVVDGPYNHHLVTDVGAFALALLLLTVVALCSRSRALVRTAGAAWVISAFPHFLYHATHRGTLGAGDYTVSVGGLALQVLLGVVCAVIAPGPEAVIAPGPEAVIAPGPEAVIAPGPEAVIAPGPEARTSEIGAAERRHRPGEHAVRTGEGAPGPLLDPAGGGEL